MGPIFEQLGKIWAELSAAQKLTIVVALLAVVVGMGALIYYTSKPQMKLLYGGIDPKEMSAVVASLDEEKIPYEIGAGGKSIFVPEEKVYQVRMKMAGQGIPSGGGVGYEIFDKGNFGISDFVQRTNFIRALQGELSRSINQLQGVRSSRVMIVMPENKLLVTNEHTRPTASVFIDVGGRSFSEENVNAIRYLVANAVEGLKTSDVAVIDSTGKVLSSEEADDPSFGQASGRFKVRKAVEDYFTQKITSLLTPVVGEGNVVVRVSADLNFDAQTLVEEKYDPEGQVIRSQTSQDDSSSSTESASSGGAAGVASNTPGGGGSGTATAGQNNTTNTRKNRVTSYEINKTVSETVKNPGSVKSLSAAVFIAKKSETGSTTTGIVTRTPQEIEMLKNMVMNALGLDPKDASAARVTVEETVFDKPALSPEKGGLMQSAASGGIDWLDGLRKILGIGAAIAVFVVFMGMLRKQLAEKPGMEIVSEGGSSSEAQKGSALTPEILNELIQNKPDNVSAALKSWVSAGQSKR
jgi:flagellar M-ring protein FliF